MYKKYFLKELENKQTQHSKHKNLGKKNAINTCSFHVVLLKKRRNWALDLFETWLIFSFIVIQLFFKQTMFKPISSNAPASNTMLRKYQSLISKCSNI